MGFKSVNEGLVEVKAELWAFRGLCEFQWKLLVSYNVTTSFSFIEN